MRRWNQLGYVASFITFCGASIFWISTITGVPGVLPAEPAHIAEWDILFWFPQASSLTTPCRTCASHGNNLACMYLLPPWIQQCSDIDSCRRYVRSERGCAVHWNPCKHPTLMSDLV